MVRAKFIEILRRMFRNVNIVDGSRPTRPVSPVTFTVSTYSGWDQDYISMYINLFNHATVYSKSANLEINYVEVDDNFRGYAIDYSVITQFSREVYLSFTASMERINNSRDNNLFITMLQAGRNLEANISFGIVLQIYQAAVSGGFSDGRLEYYYIHNIDLFINLSFDLFVSFIVDFVHTEYNEIELLYLFEEYRNIIMMRLTGGVIPSQRRFVMAKGSAVFDVRRNRPFLVDNQISYYRAKCIRKMLKNVQAAKIDGVLNPLYLKSKSYINRRVRKEERGVMKYSEFRIFRHSDYNASESMSLKQTLYLISRVLINKYSMVDYITLITQCLVFKANNSDDCVYLHVHARNSTFCLFSSIRFDTDDVNMSRFVARLFRQCDFVLSLDDSMSDFVRYFKFENSTCLRSRRSSLVYAVARAFYNNIDSYLRVS